MEPLLGQDVSLLCGMPGRLLSCLPCTWTLHFSWALLNNQTSRDFGPLNNSEGFRLAEKKILVFAFRAALHDSTFCLLFYCTACSSTDLLQTFSENIQTSITNPGLPAKQEERFKLLLLAVFIYRKLDKCFRPPERAQALLEDHHHCSSG